MRKVLVHIPEPVIVKGVAVTYEVFVRHLCDTDDRFTASASGIRAAVRLEAAIDSAKKTHLCEEGDWALLKASAETPTKGYPQLVERTKEGVFVQSHSAGRACLGFIDAISSAVPHEGATAQEGEPK